MREIPAGIETRMSNCPARLVRVCGCLLVLCTIFSTEIPSLAFKHVGLPPNVVARYAILTFGECATFYRNSAAKTGDV